ncbi:secretin receptor isoform X1 [Macaca mulatta]
MRPHLSPPLQQLLLRVLLVCAAHSTGALPRLCDVLQVLWEEQDQCLQELSREQTGDLGTEQPVPGCEGMWDNISCWPSSVPGRMVEVECPRFLRMLTSRNGSLFRNCTQDGWSETFPRPNLACGVNVNDSSNEKRHSYLLKLKVMYTVGYSSSLVMLLVALGILCAFRRLHCTRNYIHMHLFVSFILRALSNFIKDAVLFSSDDIAYCDAHRAGCKLVMVLFQYCIMANYSWLLVEGLYLHTLLAISFFSERKYLQAFVALGWGSPAIFVALWAIARHLLEDVGCWDINANASIWWIIRGPVILSILRTPWRCSCFLNWPLAHSRDWWWPSSTASSTGRCSWRFRRSGSSGTSVSSHCTPWPSAPPSATALRPATWSRARAPAGPASSERLGQGHLRTETKTGPETAGHCCGRARLPSRHPIIYPASAVEAPSQVLDSSKGMWGTVGQDKGLGFGFWEEFRGPRKGQGNKGCLG